MTIDIDILEFDVGDIVQIIDEGGKYGLYVDFLKAYNRPQSEIDCLTSWQDEEYFRRGSYGKIIFLEKHLDHEGVIVAVLEDVYGKTCMMHANCASNPFIRHATFNKWMNEENQAIKVLKHWGGIVKLIEEAPF